MALEMLYEVFDVFILIIVLKSQKKILENQHIYITFFNRNIQYKEKTVRFWWMI